MAYFTVLSSFYCLIPRSNQTNTPSYCHNTAVVRLIALFWLIKVLNFPGFLELTVPAIYRLVDSAWSLRSLRSLWSTPHPVPHSVPHPVPHPVPNPLPFFQTLGELTDYYGNIDDKITDEVAISFNETKLLINSLQTVSYCTYCFF